MFFAKSRCRPMSSFWLASSSYNYSDETKNTSTWMHYITMTEFRVKELEAFDFEPSEFVFDCNSNTVNKVGLVCLYNGLASVPKRRHINCLYVYCTVRV